MYKLLVPILCCLVFALIIFGCQPNMIYVPIKEGSQDIEEDSSEEETWTSVYVDCDHETIPADKFISLWYDWATLEQEQGPEFFAVADHSVYVDGEEMPIQAQDMGESNFDEEGGYFRQFYWMDIGYLEPGYHEIVTVVTLREQVFDGWEWYGPGAEMEHFEFFCAVEVIGADEEETYDSGEEAQGEKQEEEWQEDEQTPENDTVEEEEGEETICNRSRYVRETIPDHTVFKPGEEFQKSWTILSEGECTWNTFYTFQYTQGALMGGEEVVNMPNEVGPGEEVTLSLDLQAPDEPGVYTGRWEIFSDTGEALGWYSVVIDVGGKGGASEFAVTSVNMYFTTDGGTDNVCADITTNGSGLVTYWFEDDAGTRQVGELNFGTAATKTDCVMNINLCAGCWAKLYIDDPNHQWFGPLYAP